LFAQATPGSAAPQVLTAGLMLAATLPVAFRRRRPVLALGVILVATILATLTGPYGTLGLGVVIATYSVAAHADRHGSVLGLAMTLGAVVVYVLIEAWFNVVGVSLAIWALALVVGWMVFGATWVLGDLVRSRGEAIAQLEHRNADLEAEREENARLAVAQERARIARELHDAVAHSLSVMVVQAGAARRALETGGVGGEGSAVDAASAVAAAERARGALAAIETTGRDTLTEMRRVVGALRPAGEDAYEPQPSLDQLTALLDTVREAGLPVELVVEGEAGAVPRGVDLAAYRVIQEALTNTLKHARAASARVRLRYGAEALDIEVTDDGRGAAARLLEQTHRGYGLIGMRERVAMMGGEIVAEPGLSGGFVVRARLPLGRPL
ncbi:MAG TPA: sensor histidine kinase, partial [Candidatus Limnocylindrales bacterium]|nr:sensor histidine kinase [Candidatus Limnocylindrales bacterium]